VYTKYVNDKTKQAVCRTVVKAVEQLYRDLGGPAKLAEAQRAIVEMLAEKGIENHFIEQLDARQSLVKRAEIIPITIKVRNRVAGTLGARIGLETGTKLDSTIIEIVLRDEYLENPVINETHIMALHLATKEEVDFMIETSLKINEILSEYMADIGVELVDFKLEYGRYEGRVLLVDEIDADTSRFWDARTHEPLDIDRFRRDLGNVEQAYQDLLQRMMGDK